MLKTENLLLTSGGVQIEISGVDRTSPQVSILADHDSTLKGVVGHGYALGDFRAAYKATGEA